MSDMLGRMGRIRARDWPTARFTDHTGAASMVGRHTGAVIKWPAAAGEGLGIPGGKAFIFHLMKKFLLHSKIRLYSFVWKICYNFYKEKSETTKDKG